MTRINLIPTEELSDQHLMAEYRELPRIVNGVLVGRFKSKEMPDHYTLGAGHVLFFTNKIGFLANRYALIFNELVYRGFELSVGFAPEDMFRKIASGSYMQDDDYEFSEEEVAISRQRIIEKIAKKPGWYKWTNRPKPEYAVVLL